MRELRSGIRRGRSSVTQLPEQQEQNSTEESNMVTRRRRVTRKITKNQQEVDSLVSPSPHHTTATTITDEDYDKDGYLRGCSSVQVTTTDMEVDNKEEEQKKGFGDILEIAADIVGNMQMDGSEKTTETEEQQGNTTYLRDKEISEVRTRSTIAQMALRINDEMTVIQHLGKGLMKHKMTMHNEPSTSDEVDRELHEGAVLAHLRDYETMKRSQVSNSCKTKSKEKDVSPMETTPVPEARMSRETRLDKHKGMELEQLNSDTEDDYKVETKSSEPGSGMKRRGRGSKFVPYIPLTKSEVRAVVEYNEQGQPIGKFAAELSSYMGVLARQMVPLSHEKWNSVPDDLKEDLWRALEAKYVLQENSKKLLINGIGDRWRNFKSMLTTQYVLPFKDEPDRLTSPPAVYRHIKQDQWDAFVKSRLSDDFQALHEAQSERRAKAKFPHRMGRTSYASLVEKMRKNDGITADQLDSCLLWKKARQNKNGEYEDDLTRGKVEIIDELKKHVEEGSLVCDGVDVLRLALGTPGKPGRFRGAAKAISRPDFYQKPAASKPLKASNKLNEQSKLIEYKLQEEKVSRLRVEDQLLNTQNMVSRLEETLAYFMQNGKPPSTAEGVPLKENGTLNPPTLTSNRDSSNNDKCSASFSSQFTEGNNYSENLTVATMPKTTPMRDSNVSPFRAFYSRALQRLTGSVPYISVQVNAEVFGTEIELYLDLDDISYMCHMEDLSANCIMVYIRHLYDTIASRREHDKYEFINPVSVSSARDDNLSTILSARLQNAKCEWVLLPYNPEGAHWLLIVINMLTMSCYFLDPVQVPSQYKIKPYLTMCLKGLQKDGARKSSPIWYTIKCPTQKTNAECGFYIMKYMREVIDEASNIFTRAEPFPKSTYGQNDIDEVRLEWIQEVEKYM